jgi:hypothetical protein
VNAKTALETVTLVLAPAGQQMQAREIHAAAEALTGQRLAGARSKHHWL